MPALLEPLALLVLALLFVRGTAIDARAALAGDDTPLDDAILSALV
ncbi:MAG: hypothetical protein IT562_14730 [Alphaproteobacteria bacterium]|nr:hypothetical protein [Alphaproteobacteria bacterium]